MAEQNNDAADEPIYSVLKSSKCGPEIETTGNASFPCGVWCTPFDDTANNQMCWDCWTSMDWVYYNEETQQNETIPCAIPMAICYQCYPY